MITVGLVGVAAMLLAVQVKALKPEFAVFISLAACIAIFMAAAGRLGILLDGLKKIQSYVDLDSGYISILFKMAGIAYGAELSASLCKDAGYQAIAGQIELFGKLMLLSVSMPVLLALLETVDGFLRV